MTFVLANINALPYQGSLVGQLVSLCKPSQYPPKTIAISIDWSLYPTGAVSINLSGQAGVINPIDLIASVSINNSSISNSVDVIFPDTLFTFSCGFFANAGGPVETFQLQAIVRTVAGTTGTTTVYFNNFFLPPFTSSDLPAVEAFWIISGSSRFAPRALGELFSSFERPANFVAPQTLLPAAIGSTYVITDLELKTYGVYSPHQVIEAQYDIILGATVLYEFRWKILPGVTKLSMQVIEHYQFLNDRLNANNALVLRNNNAITVPGNLFVIIHYSRLDP